MKYFEIYPNFSLKSFNTFGVDAKTLFFFNLEKETEIDNLLSNDLISNDIFCLGGGSNILFVNDFEGLMIINNLKGIKIIDSDDESVTLEVAAGENWHDFVSLTLKNKYYGLENLAMIPGKVGAAPIQNIGAYGAEQSDFFVSLTAYDLEEFKYKTLTRDECNFGYRNSIFKNKFKKKFIITSVRYKLYRKPSINLKYKELEQEVRKIPSIIPDPEYIFETVCRIRKRKLPDPSHLGNAGSFFKNPIVEKDKYINLKSRFDEIKGIELPDGRVKIFAALLIEKCGWKGYREGDAGVHKNHSLILINYGNATGRDILKLAIKIQESVSEKFDILLDPEVEIV